MALPPLCWGVDRRLLGAGGGERRIKRKKPFQRVRAGVAGQEQAQAPGDDLAEEAEAFELLHLGIAEAYKFDALGAHDGRDLKGEIAAQGQRLTLAKKEAQGIARAKELGPPSRLKAWRKEGTSVTLRSLPMTRSPSSVSSR